MIFQRLSLWFQIFAIKYSVYIPILISKSWYQIFLRRFCVNTGEISGNQFVISFESSSVFCKFRVEKLSILDLFVTSKINWFFLGHLFSVNLYQLVLSDYWSTLYRQFISRSKTLWPNQNRLSRKIRLAQANLYLSRHGLDTVSQETADTISDYPYIIERDQFSSSTILGVDPNIESEPKTPPFWDSSFDDSNSPIPLNMPNDDLDDKERELWYDTYLHRTYHYQLRASTHTRRCFIEHLDIHHILCISFFIT